MVGANLFNLFFFYVSFKFYSSKHAILYIAPSVKLERRQSICALFRAITAGNLTPLTQFRGSTRISRERAGIQPHTITAPPANEHTPKQPCIWTRTTQIIHTIYLVITIRYFANSFRYFQFDRQLKIRLILTLKGIICDIFTRIYTDIRFYI